MTNTVRIDIEVNDNAAAASTAGQRVAEPMRQAAADIDRTFDKTSKQLANSLDKIEQEAWKSGRGMDDAFGTAMSGLRRSLELAREEAAQTGASLHSSVGASLNEIRQDAERLAGAMKPVAQAAPEVNRAWDKTARLIQTELDRIERDAWDAGRGTDKAFQTALASVRQDFDRVREAGKRTGASLESELGEALYSVRQDMKQLSSSMRADLNQVEQAGREAGDGLKDSLTDALGGVSGMAGGGAGDLLGSLTEGLTAGKAGLIGAGLAAGKFIMDGLEMEFAEDRVGNMLAAQTGAAQSQAEKLGDVAGDVFANNFGESIEEVGEAMSAVFENKLINTSASEEAIQRITEKVMTLASTTGDSFSEISNAAAQMVRTGLARSITQAMDMIQQAQENGLNATDEMMDTIQEYGTSFRKLGLDGAEAFGLLEQATDGGARNIDVAADALKEFSIRGQEMSATTRRGFESLGLDADAMSRRIAAGGSTAKEALRETLNALSAMPPSVERNSIAIDLFGTKAEDLGNALYSMDVDGAADKFGDFAGAVTEAQQKLDNMSGTQKFDKFVENTKSGLGELLDIDIPFIDDMETQIDGLNLAVEKWQATGDKTVFDELKEKYPELAGQIDDYIAKTEDEVKANDRKNDSTEEVIQSLDALISKQHELATGVMDLGEAQADNAQAFADANEAVKEFAGKGLNEAKNGFDLNTEAGQELQGSLYDVVGTVFETIEAMRQQGATSEETRAYLIAQRGEFYNLLIGMGLLPDAAQAITDKLLGLPDNVTPVVGIQDNATPTLNYLNNRLDQLESRPDIRTDYYLYTHYMSNSRAGGPTWGGTGGLAHGGIVGAGMDVWGAQSGGQRHSTTVIDEAGPEMVELPTGSRVMTAGATRAMAEAGAFNAGGGPMSLTVQLTADAGAGAGEGQYIMGLVRRGVIRLKVAANGRDVVVA